MNMKNMLLITAPPRTGKSTLIKKVIDNIGEENFQGFFTEEIRENGERVGFKIKEINGKEVILAHVNIKSNYKISRYYVDLESFESFISDFFSKIDNNKILLIDEIGPMQALSPLFLKSITKLFNTPVTILGTISFDSHDRIDEIKKSDKIELVNLTIENRDSIMLEISEKIKNIQEHYRSIDKELKRKEIKSNNYVELFQNINKNEKGEIIIKSEHATRIIKSHPVLGISCTCDVYKKANTCSHIMAYQKAQEQHW